MSSGAHLTVIPGAGPVVVLAPHGGQRDPARRPWRGERLRVNDLHTATLAAELAALLDAPAIINADHDRNDVDLNRVSETHERAPWFLAALGRTLEDTLARHGRATVLVVHGWNVIEPVVDVGLGCVPGPVPYAVDEHAAVSTAFAAGGVRALVEACGARGIDAALGVRYPARHRENLLQLFTPRYRGDARAAVHAVAVLAPRVDALQLELGIPLRWPGPWRDRFVDACRAAQPALAGAPDRMPTSESPGNSDIPQTPPIPRLPRPAAERGSPARLEFTSPGLCGLVALDRGGGRLLLFLPDGGLVLFTGERFAGRAGPLRVTATGRGDLAVHLRGPLLRFPDTTPFLDLEPGLARARLVDVDVALEFVPEPPAAGPGGESFGRATGHAIVDGTTHAITGHAFADTGAPPVVWPRFRAALRLGERGALAVTVGLADGSVLGFLDGDRGRDAVVRAGVALGPRDAPLDGVGLEVWLASGARVALVLHALHRLPVVRGRAGRAGSPSRLEFAACRLEGGDAAAAGWCELGGP